MEKTWSKKSRDTVSSRCLLSTVSSLLIGWNRFHVLKMRPPDWLRSEHDTGASWSAETLEHRVNKSKKQCGNKFLRFFTKSQSNVIQAPFLNTRIGFVGWGGRAVFILFLYICTNTHSYLQWQETSFNFCLTGSINVKSAQSKHLTRWSCRCDRGQISWNKVAWNSQQNPNTEYRWQLCVGFYDLFILCGLSNFLSDAIGIDVSWAKLGGKKNIKIFSFFGQVATPPRWVVRPGNLTTQVRNKPKSIIN
jgi:hypothetical protein